MKPIYELCKRSLIAPRARQRLAPAVAGSPRGETLHDLPQLWKGEESFPVVIALTANGILLIGAMAQSRHVLGVKLRRLLS
jgi:hypothetical protein